MAQHMEMIIAETKDNQYIAFLDEANNLCCFMPAKIRIENRSKLRRIRIEHEPLYVINQSEGVCHKIIKKLLNK